MKKREELQEELMRNTRSLILSIQTHPDYVSGESGDEWHDLTEIAEETLTALKPQEQSVVMPSEDNPISIAYEFFCSETGHSYVDYIKRSDIEQTGKEYMEQPLFYKSQLKPGYPEQFIDYCIEMVNMEEREEVDYCYAVWNKGNVLGFDIIDELYKYWQTEVNGR